MIASSRAFSRRGFVLAVGAAASGALIAACSAPAPTATTAPAKPTVAPKPATAPTAAPAAKPAEPTKPAAATAAPAAKPAASGGAVSLRAAYWSSSPEDHSVFEAVFKLFNEKNPNIKVTFDDVPSDGFDAKMQTEIAAGTPADLMELHPAWVLRFINGKRLNDLTDRMKEDRNLYVPAQLDFWGGPGGKLYGVPYYSGPSFVFYNKTLFKKVGAKTPEEHEKEGTWTWETLRKLAQQTTTGSGAERTFGWDGRDVGNMQFYFCVPVWDNGGELINKDETAWLVDQPGVVEAAQMHADMFLKEKSIPLPADVQGISWLFRTGRVGMAWAGKFRSIELTNAEFEIGIVGTPKGKVGPINRDGPNASGLPVGTKNLDQAYQVGKFFGGPDAAPVYLASGRAVPVMKQLVDSDIFKKALKPYERIEVYQQSISSVRAWRVPGRAPEINRAWTVEWDKILVGQQDASTAMKNAKAAMDPLLKF